MPRPEPRSPVLAGGCQCGAVRFAAYAPPIKVGLCHCRMCQKAVAGPFAVYAEVPLDQFAWTRGAPSTWQSSSRADRDFCARCGTPLSWRSAGGTTIELLTGAFDQPEKVVPTYEVGIEAKLSWLAEMHRIPGKTTLENMGTEEVARIVSYQHPDHDTGASWTPAGPRS